MVEYRASALGGCLKALVAGRMGFTPMEPPERMATLFAEGNIHEEAVLNTLYERGVKVRDRQLGVVLECTTSVRLTGHVDGMALLPDNEKRYVLEIKSMSDDAFAVWRDSRWDGGGMVPKYRWQVSAYMLAADAELMFVVKNRNTGELDIVFQEMPFYSRAQVVGRVLEAEAWARRGELPPCDVQQYPCPFFYLHEEPERLQVDDEEVGRLAEGYLAAQTRRKAVDLELAGLRDALKDVAADRRSDRLAVPGALVTVYEQTRKSLDRKAMIADGVDVDKYETVSKSRALRVTAVEGDEGDDVASDG